MPKDLLIYFHFLFFLPTCPNFCCSAITKHTRYYPSHVGSLSLFLHADRPLSCSPPPLLQQQHSLRRGAAEKNNRELTSYLCRHVCIALRASQTRSNICSLTSLMNVQSRGDPGPTVPRRTPCRMCQWVNVALM